MRERISVSKKITSLERWANACTERVHDVSVHQKLFREHEGAGRQPTKQQQKVKRSHENTPQTRQGGVFLRGQRLRKTGDMFGVTGEVGGARLKSL